MTANNYIKLYPAKSTPDSVYLLASGKIIFYVSNIDKYSIQGSNLIVGATEFLLENIEGTLPHRIETAVTDNQASIKRMSADKFLTGMKTFSFQLNVSMVLAKQVQLTNKIIQKNMQQLSGDESESKDLSIQYYKIVESLKKEYDKRKLPWLKTLVFKFETNLTYKRGEANYKSSEPARLSGINDISENMIEYPKDTIICEENDAGKEMFILQRGVIDVLINGKRVTSIEEPGTVTGEMALLLGEKRTATLKARNNVILTKITDEGLKKMGDRRNEILTGISHSLARRHYYNIIKIESINKSIVEQSLAEETGKGKKKIPQLLYIQKDLNMLKSEVDEVCREKKIDFLSDLIENF